MNRCRRCRATDPYTFEFTGDCITVPVQYGTFASDPNSPAYALSSEQHVNAVTTVRQVSATCLACGAVLLGFAGLDAEFRVHPYSQVRQPCRTSSPPRSSR